MKDIFDKKIVTELIDRINELNEDTQPIWGKMKVAQMLAHCNVTYELAFEDKFDKPGVLKKMILKTFVKRAVVSEKPYKRNSRTAPEFIISNSRKFKTEKKRLINYLNHAFLLGREHFDQRESHSFGQLDVDEWNNMFYKHIDHHLTQFGV